MWYTKIDRASGRLLSTGLCGDTPDELSAQANNASMAVVSGNFDTLHEYLPGAPHNEPYVVLDKEPVLRPNLSITASKPQIVADGVDEVVFTLLPNPCNVSINDDLYYVVEDGSFEFSAVTVGTYVIRFEAFPYVDYVYTVTAIAP